MSPTFSKAELNDLITRSGAGCISIFLPTGHTGREVKKGPIALKNMLQAAEKRLRAAGRRAPEAAAQLKPARALLRRSSFWRRQRDGLALFLAPGYENHYRVPLRLRKLLVVADRFHLKPLLPLLAGDGPFYVLALSQKESRLLQGTRHSLAPLEPDSLPPALLAALKEAGDVRPTQAHRNGRTPILPGDGAETAWTLRRFKKIDRGVRSLLGSGGAPPLMLAGVEHLQAVYREASAYPHVLDVGLGGSTDRLKAETLHRRAWRVIQPYYREAQRTAAARYRRLAGGGSRKATAVLRRILAAAFAGRVDVLFVAVDEQRWGRFDRARQSVEVRDRPDAGDQDLLDLAAVQAHLNGGVVYAVRREHVPGRTALAAVLRY